VIGRHEPNIQWDEALAWSAGFVAIDENSFRLITLVGRIFRKIHSD
jgi:hypothetical protein